VAYFKVLTKWHKNTDVLYGDKSLKIAQLLLRYTFCENLTQLATNESRDIYMVSW
jgi:hypothetical protein